MQLTDAVMFYLLLGMGCACALLFQRGRSAWKDALWMPLFWPLLLPFQLAMQQPPAPPVQHQSRTMTSLALAHRSALGSLLPDAARVQELVDRLDGAHHKVEEIDGLLAQPDFDELAVMARRKELQERGDERSAVTALSRLQDIKRLRALRFRFQRELDEVGELLARLRVQAELVRLAGSPGEDTQHLLDDLLARVDGLDAIMDDVQAV